MSGPRVNDTQIVSGKKCDQILCLSGSLIEYHRETVVNNQTLLLTGARVIVSAGVCRCNNVTNLGGKFLLSSTFHITSHPLCVAN